ncbi:DUF1992 domain-containing protein [Paenibacillus sp. 481]|uniref:DUF1992 domain-containing protein n=1 Tax=Paenibacillus sp. 481 TaxID=2835869 RepID=UPI001E6080FD|nr:DUF1992 domain-containing protein [Paenibacillus sp. 481]UHA73580.1 DUF1992 domain-containing protein [Paenibacillus sp. 481]
MIQHNDWMSDAFAEFGRNGGLYQLHGKGKPLDVQSGSVLDSTRKEANVRPPWLELQHEIRHSIESTLAMLNRDPATVTDTDICNINEKIRRYNKQVPSTWLQKGFVSKQHLRIQSEKWA